MSGVLHGSRSNFSLVISVAPVLMAGVSFEPCSAVVAGVSVVVAGVVSVVAGVSAVVLEFQQLLLDFRL